MRSAQYFQQLPWTLMYLSCADGDGWADYSPKGYTLSGPDSKTLLNDAKNIAKSMNGGFIVRTVKTLINKVSPIFALYKHRQFNENVQIFTDQKISEEERKHFESTVMEKGYQITQKETEFILT